MRSTSEAPVAEPHPLRSAAGSRPAGGPAAPRGRRCAVRRGRDPRPRPRVRRASGHRPARARRASRRGARHRRALGMRQVDPARAGRRAARAEPGRDRGRRRRGAARTARPMRLHAAARPAPALADGDRQRRPGAAKPGRHRGPRRAGWRIPCSSASAWPGSSARARPSCPAGCGSGSPSCGPCSPASRCCCSTSPSPPSTRSPAPRCRSGWRRRWPPSRGPRSWSPTTSRRRSTCPTGWRCCRARPARAWSPSCARRRRAPCRASRRSPRPASPPPANAPSTALIGGRAMRRWLAPLAIVLALLGAWELAARLDVLADALHIEPFLVPAPTDIASVAVERPRAARGQRLGDAEGGARGLRAVGARRDRRSRSSSTSRRPCGAPSIRCSSPRRPCRSWSSPRSSWSGSASGSARSSRSSP